MNSLTPAAAKTAQQGRRLRSSALSSGVLTAAGPAAGLVAIVLAEAKKRARSSAAVAVNTMIPRGFASVECGEQRALTVGDFNDERQT